MSITYLDGSRLRRALIAGCDHAQRRRAELNRINVFPVPDGDTGTNLALTVRSIADRLRTNRDESAAAVAHVAAEAGVLGARGNSGMILSHFLLGFSGAIQGCPRLTVKEFTGALRSAVEHLYKALERPVEGTILTVMREVVEEAEGMSTADFVELLERILARARDSLARTPDLLPALRTAGVVDAGAKGFVHLLEGMVALIHGDPFVALDDPPAFDDVEPAAARAEYPAEAERYRFCTEALVRGEALPPVEPVREALHAAGDSLIVIRCDGVLKVHIHTDDPEGVFAYLRTLGEVVTHKAEDMGAQHAAVERAAAAHIQLARRPIAIVTDSSCDLPDEILTAHGIHVVPLSLVFPDRVLRDRVDITAAEFVERLRQGEHPSTSQPPPAAFLDAFARASQDGESVLAVLLSSALSGTFASAEAAARGFDASPLTLVDSRGASLTLGLLVLLAAELAERGMPIAEIAAEIDRVRDQSGILFTVDVFDNLLASGRVGRGRAWLGTLLDIKPILGLDVGGRVIPLDRVRGRKNLIARVMELLEERLPRDAEAIRFGILHVGCEEIVPEIRAALRERWGDRETIVAPASPVLATHVGPGAWGIAYQRED